MNTKEELERLHPALEAQLSAYTEWNDLFRGGQDMEAAHNARKYLIRHPFETKAQYDIRLQRATYRNHAAAISHVFSSALENVDRSEVEKTFPDYSQDIDAMGMTSTQFFSDVVLQAAVRGVQFVVVDSPEVGKTSIAEEKQSGEHPYMISVPPWDVLDWQFAGNVLEWVKIKQTQIAPRNPSEKFSTKEQYKLWFRDKWELWELADETPMMIKTAPHSMGEVPVVPFFFLPQAHMVGTSSLSVITGLLKRIFRRDSELDKSLFDSAVEIAVFLGFTKEDLSAFTISGTNGLRSDSEGADVKYVAPTGRAYDALRLAINEDESRVREIALRMLKPDSRQIETAEAKREDRKQLDSQLVRFSRQCEGAENKCWRIFSQIAGIANAPTVTYPTDFDEARLSADLVASFVQLRQTDNISRETLWETLKAAGVLPDDFDSAEEKEKIQADLRVTPVGGLFTSRGG
jgi:hypothetical protein